MTYADVGLVNNSLDTLGSTLLKNRMLAQQERERTASQDIAQQRTDIERQAVGNQEQHYKNQERRELDADKIRTIMQQNAQSREAISAVSKAVNSISYRYEHDLIDKDQANKEAEALRQHYQTVNDVILEDSGLKNLAFNEKPKKTKGEFNTRETANAGKLRELKDDLAEAKAGGDETEIQRAQENLDDFVAMSLKPGSADFQTETEETTTDPLFPDKPKVTKRVSRRVPATIASPATRQATGGYVIGQLYKGNLIYLGGDPKDAASWKQR